MAHFLKLVLAFKQLGTPYCLLYWSKNHFTLKYTKNERKSLEDQIL